MWILLSCFHLIWFLDGQHHCYSMIRSQPQTVTFWLSSKMVSNFLFFAITVRVEGLHKCSAGSPAGRWPRGHGSTAAYSEASVCIRSHSSSWPVTAAGGLRAPSPRWRVWDSQLVSCTEGRVYNSYGDGFGVVDMAGARGLGACGRCVRVGRPEGDSWKTLHQ